MIGMLRSEIYKLFKKKSFYICGLISMVLIGLTVWTYEWQVNDQLGAQYAQLGIPFDGIDLKRMGYTAWNALEIFAQGSNIGLLCAIFSSIFVCSEFSSGAIKNLAIRGKNRFIMYFSKLIVCMLVPIIYVLFSALSAYLVGAYIWSAGEWKNQYVDSILIPIGLNTLVQVILQSVLVMIGYLLRSSGWAMALNFGIASGVVPALMMAGVNYISRNWFGITNVVLSKYWIGFYEGKAWPLEDSIKSCIIWVFLAYLIIPSIIGSIVFWKREIK